MPIMTKRLGWLVIPVLALAHVALAGAAGPSSRPHATSILGAAWNHDNTPIQGANLRLRNVVSGKAIAVTKANEYGRFTFESVEPGIYVVELVNDAGHVLTVGHVFTIAPGETVATFVRLGPHQPWTSLFFSSTAAGIAATAATEGITAFAPLGQGPTTAAVAPLVRCVSPPCN
jgi:hypothetical protein